MGKRTVKSFEMDMTSLCSIPLVSARANSFIAGGPDGMTIMVNHSILSSPKMFVLAANP